MKYKYTTEDSGDDVVTDAYEFESSYDIVEDDIDKRWLAEEAADDYHHNHDGWDSSWPMIITIYTEDNVKIGTYSIDREFDPTFIATKL